MTSGPFDFLIYVKDQLPYGLFLFSVILSGNIVRSTLIIKTHEDLKELSIKLFNLFAIASGFTVNIITLAWLKIFSFNDLSIYLSSLFWFRLAIITTVFTVATYHWNKYGSKWINDWIKKMGLLVLLISIGTFAFNTVEESYGDLLNIFECFDAWCYISLSLKMIFGLAVITICIYLIYKLFKELVKSRRYREKERA